MKKDYTVYVIIFGIIVAWIMARFLNSPAPTSNVNLDSQRGSFGTDTGLYGSTIAAQTVSGTTG